MKLERGDPTAQGDTFKELVEQERDQQRDKLGADGGTEGDTNNDRVESDAEFKDESTDHAGLVLLVVDTLHLIIIECVVVVVVVTSFDIFA